MGDNSRKTVLNTHSLLGWMKKMFLRGRPTKVRTHVAILLNVNIRLKESDLFTNPTTMKLSSSPNTAFKALLDNYELECGKQEVVTDEERKENRDFIDAIMETDVMQEAHKYLVQKGKAPEDEIEFKRLLYRTWFSLIRRTKGDR